MRARIVATLMAAAVVTGCGGAATSTGGTQSQAPARVSHGPLDLVEPGVLTVASDPSYPPQEFYDLTTKQPVGFDLELAAQIAARLGLRFRLQTESFSNVLPAVSGRRADLAISAITITEQRRQSAYFVPYLIAGMSMVVGQASGFRPTALDDLCGKRVAVQVGTIEAEKLRSLACSAAAPTVLEFEQDTKAAEQMAAGTVDAYLTDSPQAAYDTRLQPNLIVSGPTLEPTLEGIALRSGDRAMLDAVTQALSAMQKDGSYRALLVKWLLTESDIGPKR